MIFKDSSNPNCSVTLVGKFDVCGFVATQCVEHMHIYKPAKESIYFEVHFCVGPKILMTYKSCIAVVKIIIENDTFFVICWICLLNP